MIFVLCCASCNPVTSGIILHTTTPSTRALLHLVLVTLCPAHSYMAVCVHHFLLARDMFCIFVSHCDVGTNSAWNMVFFSFTTLVLYLEAQLIFNILNFILIFKESKFHGCIKKHEMILSFPGPNLWKFNPTLPDT